jgi:DNA-binding transcriptional regulator YiaG
VTERDLLFIAAAREAAKTGEARRLREAAGLSQVEVALTVGVTSQAVNRWESRSRSPRGRAAVRYGRLLERLADRERTMTETVA